VGFGVITENVHDDSVIGPESATIGTILKQNGYATSWFGKNHNTPSYQLSSAGPFDQWPSGMGFDHFYGFNGGETDQWTPFLFRDKTRLARRHHAAPAALGFGFGQVSQCCQRLHLGALQHRRGLFGEQRPRRQDARQAARMKELFLVEAQKYNVFPLDNSFSARAAAPRPSATAGRTVFTYSGESSGLPYSDAPDITGKSYSITAEVEVPQGGAEGMINTLGGRAGGHGLYLLKGKPVFVYNFFDVERFRWEGQAALTPGKHTVMFDFKYDGPGFGKGGTGVLSVDGKEVASKTIPHTMPFLETIDETFDVGIDTRTGVDDNDYQVPFRFTGKLDKLTIKLIPLKAAEEQHLQKQIQDAKNRAQ
jgi:Sulfatase